MSSDNRFALLIDADNVAPKYIGSILDELSTDGTITYKRIYGDWTRPELGQWKKCLLNYSITPIQQYGYTSGKNATDSAMIIDAMDILYTNSVEGFCIVSSDSDFTRLAARLRESGKYVIGMGEKKTPKPFISACDKFRYLEVISAPAASAPPEKLSESAKPSKAAKSSKAEKSEAPAEHHEEQTSAKVIKKAIKSIIEEVSDEDGWAPLSHVGNILLKRFPDFDVRNYGFTKLTMMMKSFGCFEIDAEKSNGNKLIYVRIKDS